MGKRPQRGNHQGQEPHFGRGVGCWFTRRRKMFKC